MKWKHGFIFFFAAITSKTGLAATEVSIKEPDGEIAHFLDTHCIKCRAENVTQEDQMSNVGQNAKMLVFVSFSLPLQSWKDFSYVMQKTEGVFVLRGIPENSFESFYKKLVELRAADVHAPIQIDPLAFEKYQIEAVPTVILKKEDVFDKMIGNIPLQTSLRFFAENGNCRKEADQILQDLRR